METNRSQQRLPWATLNLAQQPHSPQPVLRQRQADRVPAATWHEGAKCWTSAVGENGRRKPVYFWEIPYGPKGSPSYRKAQDELRKYLDARDARK